APASAARSRRTSSASPAFPRAAEATASAIARVAPVKPCHTTSNRRGAAPVTSHVQPDRAAHAGAADAAVAVRVLGQVLLVVVLGVVERRRREQDLGGDVAVAGGIQLLLVGVAAGDGRIEL